jgi:hypothetical protein
MTINKSASLLGALSVLGEAQSVAKAVLPESLQSVSGVAEALRGITPTGRALNAAQKARALANPGAKAILTMGQDLSTLGVKPQDASNIAKALESIHKAEQAKHAVAKQNSLLGQFSASTLGQLTLPVIAMGAVSGGAVAAAKAINVLNAAGINFDPTARLAAKVGLNRVLEAVPSLKTYPPLTVQKAYETVFNHSPELVNSPVAMGNAIERVIQLGGGDTAPLREISEYQKAVGTPAMQKAELFQLGNNFIRN